MKSIILSLLASFLLGGGWLTYRCHKKKDQTARENKIRRTIKAKRENVLIQKTIEESKDLPEEKKKEKIKEALRLLNENF